jgi:hypothetical protein
MKIGDLVEYTENEETFIGLVIEITEALPRLSRGVKVLWCFNEEDRELFDETSWLCEDEVRTVSKRT